MAAGGTWSRSRRGGWTWRRAGDSPGPACQVERGKEEAPVSPNSVVNLKEMKHINTHTGRQRWGRGAVEVVVQAGTPAGRVVGPTQGLQVPG